jgi:hypothetical protein
MGGRGYGMGLGYGYGRSYQKPQKKLEEKEAKGFLENYLGPTRNPNLKLSKITEQGFCFETEITSKDGPRVDKILVDRYTGWIESIY